ncbi:MAG: hypothetical protein RPR97_06880 [Colwellia sp.]
MGDDSDKKVTLSEESASVQSHLSIMQAVIQRMAANSTSCKAWCITIVSAILVLIADKNKPELALLALLPTFLFLALDAYYLALEKAFRSSYNSFIKKLHSQSLNSEDLYSVTPAGNMNAHQMKSLKSFSVWGFYGALFILVVLAKEIVLS